MVERTVTTAVPVCSNVTACPSCQAGPRAETLLPPPSPGLQPAPAYGRPLGPPPGYYASYYDGRPADLPIYRDLATGRTYRYPPAGAPADRLVADPWLSRPLIPAHDGFMRLASYGLVP